MQKAWCSIEEVSYWIWRSFIKFQGHKGQKHLQFGPNWKFLDCNSSFSSPWWRHQMETFSALLAICVGNSPVNAEFPAQRPVTWSFDVFFDQCLNKQLSKQWCGWWSETLTRSFWPQFNGWLWNDAQTLMYYRRDAPLFFKVINEISRSHRPKNWRFESKLGKIIRLFAAIKSLRFALFSNISHCKMFFFSFLSPPFVPHIVSMVWNYQVNCFLSPQICQHCAVSRCRKIGAELTVKSLI